MTPQDTYDLVNTFLPSAKASMLMAYISAGSLVAILLAVISRMAGLIRISACFTLLVGVGLGFWLPARTAPVLGVLLIGTSMMTILRETRRIKAHE